MAIGDKIRDEKLQYDINRKAAKITALSSGKTDKYEYLADKQVLPCDQRRVIEHAKYTYALESFGKTNKNDWRSMRKVNKGTLKAWKITNYVSWSKRFFSTF